MTQKNKELLLKDLCGRLPYGVKVCIDKDGYEVGRLNCIERFVDEKSGECWCGTIGIYRGVDLKRIKPYLRPMSSMTEEELAEWEFPLDMDYNGYCIPSYPALDWLNKNHFDYHGLIPMGLALEAPEGMYKTE